jgi:hypothetical protein
VPHLPAAGNGIISVPSEGWFDLETTRLLWETVFRAPKSIANRQLWVDRPSAGIPYLYVRTGLVLSTSLAQLGRTDEAARARADVERIAHATQLDDLLARASP